MKQTIKLIRVKDHHIEEDFISGNQIIHILMESSQKVKDIET